MRGDEQVKLPPLPVTVSQLPVTRCQICHRTVADQLGQGSPDRALPTGTPRSARALCCVAGPRRSPYCPCGPADSWRSCPRRRGGWQHQSRNVAGFCRARVRTDRSVRRIRISASLTRSDGRAGHPGHASIRRRSTSAAGASSLYFSTWRAYGTGGGSAVTCCRGCNSRVRSLSKPRSRRNTASAKVVLGVRLGCGPPENRWHI